MLTHHVLYEVHGQTRRFMSVPTELNKRDSDMRTFGLHDTKRAIIHTFWTLTHSYICMWSFPLSTEKIYFHQSEKFGHKDDTTSLPSCGEESQVNLYVPNADSLLQNNIKKRENKTCPVGAATSEKDSVHLTGGQRTEGCTTMFKCTRQSTANKTVCCCVLVA